MALIKCTGNGTIVVAPVAGDTCLTRPWRRHSLCP